MKFELPKNLRINNRPWKVVKDKRCSSDRFSYNDMKIRIGVVGNSNREMLMGLMHEVAEISCVEHGVRTTKSMLQHESNDYVFVASHKDFTEVMIEVSEIVGNMMKLK